MKVKNNLAILFILLSAFVSAQHDKAIDSSFSFVIKAKKMSVVTPVFDEPILPLNEDGKTHVVRNKMRRNKFTNSEHALPKGGDPLVGNQKSSHPNKAPIMNWEGLGNAQSGGAVPPDPSGAVGTDHYVQMVNAVYRVFDKNGNALSAPATLGSLLGGGNAGDPIVMYDKYADRWFLSQFKGYPMGEVFVAVSQTADPLGAYYLYEFDLGSFPDYPKYSIWSDGYYLTANKSGENTFVMERDKMLLGDPSAQIIGFTIPSLSTPGFFSVLPATASSTLPAVGTPNYLFYFQDDAWAGGTDNLKIWEVSVDWATPTNSSISAPQVLNVTPFDSEFDANWNDITQPGTSSKIDAVPGALMYMGHYRSFNNYNAIVLNHTVDVNGANLAGIRWYELRQSGTGPWTLHQEGTFSPDTENRWMGSIAMDYQGNIGLAYAVSGATTFPSLRYTGRYATDPLGQMTLNEGVIVNGTSSQTGVNRFGDYAQMTIDPTDDATFWFTGEYISNGWKTRIASFKIANDSDDDIGISAVTSPSSGGLSGSEQVTVTINNYGLNPQSNFPVSYQIDGGSLITETYAGTLAAGSSTSYTFNATGDFSNIGAYTIVAYTDLVNDQARHNDTISYQLEHIGQNDVGVTTIISPASDPTLGANETVTVALENFGLASQSNFPIHYQINQGSVVNEVYNGTLAPGATTTYSFTTTANLSQLGSYTILSYTGLPGDLDLLNDTTIHLVEHEICMPEANCSSGDGLIKVELETLENNTACSGNGYGDYTHLGAVNLENGASYNLKLQSGYSNQRGTVWIDFNDNFEFETSERLITNTNFGTSIHSVALAIPANANLGEHLMRIRTNWKADVIDGCSDVSYGETEDYFVNIIPFTGIDEKYKNVAVEALSKTNNQFEITVKHLQGEEVKLEVHNSIGQKIEAAEFDAQNKWNLDLSQEAVGYYLIRVGNANFSKVLRVWVK
ncbi:MAG: GEVED domain-containing protein [Flavobacteriales bacterium]|jgi:hypothetical protein|nr:GEVED domain-containing protein [Flavobacteriales bacterium]